MHLFVCLGDGLLGMEIKIKKETVIKVLKITLYSMAMKVLLEQMTEQT